MSDMALTRTPEGALAEAQRLFKKLFCAGSKGAGIRDGAHALGWRYSRAKALVYGETRRIDAHELDQLRAEDQRRWRRLGAAIRERQEAKLRHELELARAAGLTRHNSTVVAAVEAALGEMVGAGPLAVRD